MPRIAKNRRRLEIHRSALMTLTRKLPPWMCADIGDDAKLRTFKTRNSDSDPRKLYFNFGNLWQFRADSGDFLTGIPAAARSGVQCACKLADAWRTGCQCSCRRAAAR